MKFNKKILVYVVIAAVAVIAGAGLYTMGLLKGSSDPSSLSTTQQETVLETGTSVDPGTAAGSVGAGDPSGQDTSSQSSGASGAQVPATGTSKPKAGTSAGSPAGTATSKPAPTPDATPAKIVANGKALPDVQNPPTKTLAMLELKEVPKEGASVKVTFRLYGTAMGNSSFVLAVQTAEAVSKSDASKTIVDRVKGGNVLVESTPESAKVITSGGIYEGVLKTVSQGGTTYALALDSAKVVK